jgi:HSP20 family protein
MPLLPYEHFRHLDTWRNEFDRVFPGFFKAFNEDFAGPRIDVFETDKEIVAACEIPGLENAEDVNIDVAENMLTLSGQIHKIYEVKEEQLHRKERFSGKFQRSVSLPAKVLVEGTKAKYRNGILEIRMPKHASINKKRINIDFEQ